MTDRIDHAAEARKWLETAFRQPDPPVSPEEIALQHAQVHATLALAGQQRIANLIALDRQWEETGYPNLDAVAPVLRPDIARALGLGVSDD